MTFHWTFFASLACWVFALLAFAAILVVGFYPVFALGLGLQLLGTAFQFIGWLSGADAAGRMRL